MRGLFAAARPPVAFATPADVELIPAPFTERLDYRRHPATPATVEISPPELVRRRVIVCPGLAAESVQAASHSKVEYSFHGQTHLLVIYEDGARTDGRTCVQGLPQATLKSFAHKFTFVPAGYQYHEFDPGKLIAQSDAR